MFSQTEKFYFKGGWVKNIYQMNGLGLLYLFDNTIGSMQAKEKYYGYFINSNLEFLGIKSYSNGLNYLGEIKNNLNTGYCEIIDTKNKMTFNYEGIAFDSLYEGYGELSFNNSYYIGGFHKGKKSGIGFFLSKSELIEYIGSFEDNNFHGLGLLKWNNNEKESQYYGEFSLGRIDGFGKLIYKNNDEYIGYFKNGGFHGFGEFKSSGKILKGNWEDGKKQDWFECFSLKDNSILYIKFKKNVQVSVSKNFPNN